MGDELFFNLFNSSKDVEKLGKFLGMFDVYDSTENWCKAEFKSLSASFEYGIARPSCFTRCFYIDIPLYAVLVGTVGDFDIKKYVKDVERKRVAVLVGRYGVAIRKINAEWGRFLVYRAYKLFTGTFDPKETGYDIKQAQKMLEILSRTTVQEPPKQYC